MKTNKLILMSSVLTGIIAFSVLTGYKSGGTGAAGPESGTPSGAGTKEPTQKIDFLFVQSATNVTFENGNTMTLHGVNPQTVCFADRPERLAGHMPHFSYCSHVG